MATSLRKLSEEQGRGASEKAFSSAARERRRRRLVSRRPRRRAGSGTWRPFFVSKPGYGRSERVSGWFLYEHSIGTATAQNCKLLGVAKHHVELPASQADVLQVH